MDTSTIDLELDLARNGLGRPLSDEIRTRLRRVILNPRRYWDDAHGIILNRNVTLWQAVMVIDRRFPASKPCEGPWPVYPTQIDLVEAIRYATH